jgi:hypothetical protein
LTVASCVASPVQHADHGEQITFEVGPERFGGFAECYERERLAVCADAIFAFTVDLLHRGHSKPPPRREPSISLMPLMTSPDGSSAVKKARTVPASFRQGTHRKIFTGREAAGFRPQATAGAASLGGRGKVELAIEISVRMAGPFSWIAQCRERHLTVAPSESPVRRSRRNPPAG